MSWFVRACFPIWQPSRHKPTLSHDHLLKVGKKLHNGIMALFSEVFDLDPAVLEQYGAFDISLSSDLPLFIDPFLLFDSHDNKYIDWHEDIIDYLSFLREKSLLGQSSRRHIKYYYGFPEVKQNWLGFTQFSNEGRGAGSVIWENSRRQPEFYIFKFW